MGLTISSAPAVEPVSSTEVKNHLRVDDGDTSQDNVITILIKAARQAVEIDCGRALINRTFTWVINSEQATAPIWLPMPPVSSITSVTTYDDSSGSEVGSVVTSTNYQLIEGRKLVQRNDGWSVVRPERAMQIVFVSGYGAASTDVPQPLKLAVLRTIANQYELREDFIEGSFAHVPEDAQALIERYRYGHL